MLGLTVTTPGLVAPAHDSGRRRRLERRRHVAAITVAAATLGATVAGWAPSPTAAVVIVLVAVAVGLPHGALDVVIGPSMTKPIVFLGSYLGVASATVLLWIGFPLLGFGLFFSASWYHFARGDADHHRELGRAGGLSGISTAGCAIGLPLALHSTTVAPVLSNILLGTATLSSDQVTVIGVIIAAPSIICGVLAGIAAIRARRFAAVTELTAIAALAAVVHPLVSFALYFSLWHSPRHLIALDVDRRGEADTRRHCGDAARRRTRLAGPRTVGGSDDAGDLHRSRSPDRSPPHRHRDAARSQPRHRDGSAAIGSPPGPAPAATDHHTASVSGPGCYVAWR